MAKRSRWRVATLSVAVAASLAAGAFFGLRAPVVATVSPLRADVTETVVSSGRVLPPAEINLGTLVASTVREVHVKEGDPVRVGQLLVQLEDRELVAAVQQAEAALAQAQAGRFELSKISEPAAKSALTKAEATLADSKRNLQRAKELFESEVGTRAAYDDAQMAYAVATAQHEAAQLQLKATAAGGSQSLVVSAAVASAKAQVERAKAQLARTRIESPVDGVVLARYLEPGDSVVAGSKLLLLARTGATRLVIEPDERNLARLAVGQRATASAEAFPGDRFDATVQYLAPSVDAQRGTIEVHLAVPEAPAYLRPHMTVSVEVVLGTRQNTLLVPRGAVRGLATEAPFVLTVEAGRVVSVPVRVGIRGDDRVEILEGLADDATLVADETSTLTPGARVRATAQRD
jgi:HlyD family secretion protein